LYVLNGLPFLPTLDLEQTAKFGEAWGWTSAWSFAVQKWESGCSVGYLPFQQPAYPPKAGAVLQLAFFVIPVALSAAAMAQCLVSQAQNKALTMREASRKNSSLKLCVVKNCSAAV